MEIRKLKKEEHKDTRKLYEEIFTEDSESFVDYYYTEKTRDNDIYVVCEEGEICAMLHLNPYRLMVNGNEKPAHYIVAVATKESCRRRGYMAALMHRALRDMYAAGEAFTYLMPAAEEIYLPHGFRTIYEQKKEFCPDCLEGKEEGIVFRKAEEEELKELSEAIEAYLKEHFQVYAKRDKAYYSRLAKEGASEGGRLIIGEKDGNITGCLIDYGLEGAEEEEKDLPKIMARAVDMRRLLMSMALKSLTAVCFQVTDPVIEENNRCIVLTGTEFSGVMLMDGQIENSEGVITISALTSLLFGAEDVEAVSLEDGVNMSQRMKEELRKLIPLKNICLNEEV